MNHQGFDGPPLVVAQQRIRPGQLFEDGLRIIPGRSRHGSHRAYSVRRAAATESGRLTRVLLALDLQRDVDELVLLAADELALTGAMQQLVRGHAVAL